MIDNIFKKDTPYIIAEIGANHNGDMQLAKEMVRRAKICGADCVKFQIKMSPNELATYDHALELNSGKIRLENVKEWKNEKLGLRNIFEQTKKFHLDKKQYEELINFANDIGIDASASVFTKEGVDFLSKQNIAFIKVASMDFVNQDLIQYMYSTGIPIIASTGMCSEKEIDEFVNNIPKDYKNKIGILHCVSIYPPKEEILQLNFIRTLKEKYNLPIGFSDHTIGTFYSLLSIGLGATILEKHFTLDKNLPGWDHKVSANPEELEFICKNAPLVKKSLGDGRKKVTNAELKKRKKFRRSLTTKNKLEKGQIIERKDLTYKRPGTGIKPDEIKYILGKKVNKDIDKDKLIKWEDIN